MSTKSKTPSAKTSPTKHLQADKPRGSLSALSSLASSPRDSPAPSSDAKKARAEIFD
jgi:hypothetical protein